MKNHHKTFYLPWHASNQGSFYILSLADSLNIKYISSDWILLGGVLIRHYQGGEIFKLSRMYLNILIIYSQVGGYSPHVWAGVINTSFHTSSTNERAHI